MTSIVATISFPFRSFPRIAAISISSPPFFNSRGKGFEDARLPQKKRRNDIVRSVNLRNRCLLKKKRLKAVVISVFSQILLGRRFRKRVNRVNYLMELGEEVASGRDQSGTIMAIMPLSLLLFLSRHSTRSFPVRVRVTKGDLESLIALLVHSITLIHSRDPYTSLVPRYSD